MADIYLNHEALNEAVEELTRAAGVMDSNLEELQSELKVLESQAGQYKEAFEAFFAVVSANQAEMRADLAKGASTLSDMHETMRRADISGAMAFEQR
ncbi:hypothetical protein OG455_09900 [Kitasatospora sp. NBC_01287]|uniref:WXG100 family type VII secretion target n=1 Tax=Kitasatospora sp. NBC_01287 TaxID=2903573 RepID=UPI00225584DF|nr:hypothetical protein [Kitasatospora sp. NBC_01287]MCX4745833.1 hypothetical protein [Kitasatospora sp. NBC_01287]